MLQFLFYINIRYIIEVQLNISFVLLMILQRYTFGSKSQQMSACSVAKVGCLWYCKDIHLEANHNRWWYWGNKTWVAYDIAKIYIWKQITTDDTLMATLPRLLMILQRYTFGSKSQQGGKYHVENKVAYDIAKIYIWKQITTII